MLKQALHMRSAGQAGTPEAGKAHGLRQKKRRKWVLFLLIPVLAAGCWTALRGRDTGPGTSAYATARAERRDLSVSVSGAATLCPADAWQVTALVSGEILDAPFEELGTVEEGQLLYTLDPAAAQNAADSAALSAAQQESAYRQALSERQPAAPTGGAVAETYVRDGSTVNSGDPLIKIVADPSVTADFLFSYTDPSCFWAGQAAEVYVDGYEDPVEGSVTAVSDGSALTSGGAQSCSVRVSIPNPGALTDGAQHTAWAVIGGRGSAASAELKMSGSTVVRAETPGTVSGFSWLTGSHVRRGETLCTISSPALDSRIESARLALQAARLQIRAAESALDAYRITAPISGTVIEKKFKAGDKVNGAESGPLAVIYDLRHLKMEMAVGELDIGKVAVGQSVSVTAAALPGQTFTGRVEKVGVAGKTEGGFTAYPVTIVVEDYGALRPGMNVSAVITCETVRDALCVPVDAVARGGTVLVAAEGESNGALDMDACEERTVVLGFSDGEYVQITSGLREGETVVYQAAQVMEG